jgi:adenylate cyclase
MGATSEKRVSKSLWTFKKALLAGMIGVLFFLPIMGLEESFGLETLFRLRGVRQPPPEVVIVTADKSSSNSLSLHDDPQKWPRWIHGGLADALARSGAAVIAFNLFFHEPKDPHGEEQFGRAMKRAGNVVLCQCIQIERRRLLESGAGGKRTLEIEQVLSPLPLLSESAAGLAPFAIPKIPVKVSGFWTFRESSGEIPSLPVIAFQLYARGAYERLARVLPKHCPVGAARLQEAEGTMVRGGVESMSRLLREVFSSSECFSPSLLAELSSGDDGGGTGNLGRAMVDLYRGPGFRYLNFYGPAGTIPTIPYFRALDPGGNGIEFRGKAVFVGVSENHHPEHQQGFYTVYSGSDGMDLSGVEIAATAFANILESNFLRPLPFAGQLLLIFGWGALVFAAVASFPLSRSIPVTAGLALGYLAMALVLFREADLWLPVVVPLVLQAPLTTLWGVERSIRRSNQERDNIRKAFGHYLPEQVVDQIAKDAGRIGKEKQVVRGFCLCTDAHAYSALAELLTPEDLSDHMNRYYSSIFEPVIRHGGLISDVVGDSMMALWTFPRSSPFDGTKACQAALEIMTCSDEFNSMALCAPLHTRIGLAEGSMVLGHVGAGRHFEYRAVGDTVNTSNRLQGLNKALGTRIVVSRAVVMQSTGMLFRPLGIFLLPGKVNPIEAYELLCPRTSASQERKLFCMRFAEALQHFVRSRWAEAEEKFAWCLESMQGHDGPSRFYLSLCRERLEFPDAHSGGIVTILTK